MINRDYYLKQLIEKGIPFVVCPPMGMKFYGIAAELEGQLHKTIDLHTHRELVNSPQFAEEILKEGIKIYG